jgi:Ni,Fe-hydrogenase III small subunit
MKQNANNRKPTSIFIFPLHLGGSNGAKLELDAIFTPPYNAARHGISLTSSPYHADVVVLLGAATAKAIGPAFDLLRSLPDDVKLILLGSEASSAAPFARAYAVLGPLLKPQPKASETDPEADPKSKITRARMGENPKLVEGVPLPPGKHLAAYVAGSPPDPESIVQAILQVAS